MQGPSINVPRLVLQHPTQGCTTDMWRMGVTHNSDVMVKFTHAMITRMHILCDIDAKLLFPEICFGKPNDTLTVRTKSGQGGISSGRSTGPGAVVANTKSSRILTPPNDHAAKLQARALFLSTVPCGSRNKETCLRTLGRSVYYLPLIT